jgi:hypothetical protein
MVTRRSARFAELAQLLESECFARGVAISSAEADRLLNEHIAYVANMMGVGERAAFGYAHAGVVVGIADALHDEAGPRGHPHTDDSPPLTPAPVVDLDDYRLTRDPPPPSPTGP